MSRISKSQAGLAGWLFADLSLVLTIVMIGSSITASDIEVRPEDPSTTTVGTSLGNSLDVNPIKITVLISNPRNPGEVQSQLESVLNAQQKLGKSTRFGVVIIHGGTGGPLNSSTKNAAQSRAGDVAESLRTWSRLTTRRWISGNQAIESDDIREFQVTLLEDLTTTDE
ncbi:MAG: hypothetical protein EBU84_09020 [Actinobacteria bacterium]|nr:hypothetical protein [Actinomycetota bacterium]